MSKKEKETKLDVFELHDAIMNLIFQTDFNDPYIILGVLDSAKADFRDHCKEVEKEWEEEHQEDDEEEEISEPPPKAIHPRPSVSSKINDVMFL